MVETNNILSLVLSLKYESIFIERSVIAILGNPLQVQLLINEETKSIALHACQATDASAIVVTGAQNEYMQISGASLLKRIKALTGWKDDGPWILSGRAHPEAEAVVFDLDTARPADIITGDEEGSVLRC